MSTECILIYCPSSSRRWANGKTNGQARVTIANSLAYFLHNFDSANRQLIRTVKKTNTTMAKPALTVGDCTLWGGHKAKVHI